MPIPLVCVPALPATPLISAAREMNYMQNNVIINRLEKGSDHTRQLVSGLLTWMAAVVAHSRSRDTKARVKCDLNFEKTDTADHTTRMND